MLEESYQTQFRKLIDSLDWGIELPREWSDFFQVQGEVSTCVGDERTNQRLMIRTHAALWFEKTLPFRPRSSAPVGVYTRDFSRQGAGLISPIQIYPEESVRAALPSFWVQLKVVRCRRITSRCYEIGTELIRRHDPSMDAFDGQLASSDA